MTRLPEPSAALYAELRALYSVLHPKLERWFRHAGVGEAMARELAQDTFLNALRGLPSFHGDSKLSTWVWAIAANVLRGHWRSAAQRGADAPSGGDDEPIDPDSLSDGTSPHQRDCDECVRRGFAAFAKLHPERAQAIYLAVIEGYSREELAAHLGRTPHAATEYLSQCKAKLKPFIQDCHDD